MFGSDSAKTHSVVAFPLRKSHESDRGLGRITYSEKCFSKPLGGGGPQGSSVHFEGGRELLGQWHRGWLGNNPGHGIPGQATQMRGDCGKDFVFTDG